MIECYRKNIRKLKNKIKALGINNSDFSISESEKPYYFNLMSFGNNFIIIYHKRDNKLDKSM